MNRMSLARIALTLLITLPFSIGCEAQKASPQEASKEAPKEAKTEEKKKEFAFQGKIEKIDAVKKTVTVHNADVPGWMSSMTMSYTLDKPDAIKDLKPGDEITAKVYQDDFKVLYDVKVEPAKAPAEKDKAKK